MSKALANDKEVCVQGYASVFKYADQAHDIIRAGAFKESIAKQGKQLKLLWQHDANNPIGSIVHIKEDNYGLFIKATITNKTQIGREAIELIRSRIVSGLSVGILPQKSFINAKGYNEISEAALYEVSVVTFPANLYAKISSMQETPQTDAITQLIHSAKSLKLSLQQ
jgi:HK97 family phage prohead protease